CRNSRRVLPRRAGRRHAGRHVHLVAADQPVAAAVVRDAEHDSESGARPAVHRLVLLWHLSEHPDRVFDLLLSDPADDRTRVERGRAGFAGSRKIAARLALDVVPKNPVAGRAALRVLRDEVRRDPGGGRRDRWRVHRLGARARLPHDPGAVFARHAGDGDGCRAPDLAGRGAVWARARPRTDVRRPRHPAAIRRGRNMLLTRESLPQTISDIAALDDLLCRPRQALIDDLRKINGDIMILGVAGKMGPTLAGLAKAAVPARRVIGVARFSDAGVKDWLRGRGVETINCD